MEGKKSRTGPEEGERSALSEREGPALKRASLNGKRGFASLEVEKKKLVNFAEILYTLRGRDREGSRSFKRAERAGPVRPPIFWSALQDLK